MSDKGNKGDKEEGNPLWPWAEAIPKYAGDKVVKVSDKVADTLLTQAFTKAATDLMFKGKTEKKGLDPVVQASETLRSIDRELQFIRQIMQKNSDVEDSTLQYDPLPPPAPQAHAEAQNEGEDPSRQEGTIEKEEKSPGEAQKETAVEP